MNNTRHNLEPIAVTGIGCRFPGGICDPASFWDVLRAGRNVITETPPDRWDLDAFYHPDPEKPGRMATRFGGYLEAIDAFDAAFFGFSPREAAFLDPQQRLLLEIGLGSVRGRRPSTRRAGRHAHVRVYRRVCAGL